MICEIDALLCDKGRKDKHDISTELDLCMIQANTA